MVDGRATENQRRPLVAHVLMFALTLVTVVTVAGCSHHAADLRYRVAQFTKIAVDRDLAYGPGGAQRLDVYRPAGDAARARPALVWVHGGGFAAGSKSDGPLVSFPSEFAKLGYVAVSIDYRLVATQPCIADALATDTCTGAIAAATEDARAAIDWLRANADAYGVDPARVAIAGESAGGIVATSVATAGRGRDEVRAFVSVSGGLLPTTSVDAGDAPGCLISNRDDPWVPYEWSAGVAGALDAAGVPSDLRTLDGVGHVPVADRSLMFDEARAFLYQQLDLRDAATS